MDEDWGEICLEEKVEQLYRRGLSEEEIAQNTGLQKEWVEDLVALLPEWEEPDG